MMFSFSNYALLYTFCLHFYLINIYIFDYLDSCLSGLFTEVLTSPDNRGSTVHCLSKLHSDEGVHRKAKKMLVIIVPF